MNEINPFFKFIYKAVGTGTYSDKLNRPLREAQASGHFLLNFSLTKKYSENVQSEYELLNKYKNKDKN